MNLIVDGAYRGEPAGAQAGNGLQRKKHIVGSGFVLGQSEDVPEFLQDGNRLTDMTCRSVAYLDDIPALGIQRKIFIEGGNPVNLRFAQMKLMRDIG